MNTRFFAGIAVAAIALGLAVPASAETVDEHTERRMKAMDADSDGAITYEEFTAFRNGWASKRDNAEQLMNPPTVRRAFDRSDKNGDGSISYEELREETANMAQHRGG